MVDQPIGRRSRLSYDVRVVAVREQTSSRQPQREESLGPRLLLSVGGPRAISVPRQAVDKADVDRRFGAVVPHCDSVWERSALGGWGRGVGWVGVCEGSRFGRGGVPAGSLLLVGRRCARLRPGPSLISFKYGPNLPHLEGIPCALDRVDAVMDDYCGDQSLRCVRGCTKGGIVQGPPRQIP